MYIFMVSTLMMRHHHLRWNAPRFFFFLASVQCYLHAGRKLSSGKGCEDDGIMETIQREGDRSMNFDAFSMREEHYQRWLKVGSTDCQCQPFARHSRSKQKSSCQNKRTDKYSTYWYRLPFHYQKTCFIWNKLNSLVLFYQLPDSNVVFSCFAMPRRFWNVRRLLKMPVTEAGDQYSIWVSKTCFVVIY